jgi:fructokinase
MRIGIDLGGTKIELIALNDAGHELLRRRETTPQGDYQETVRVMVRLVAQAEAELGQRGSIGIGTPGAVSRATGLMKNCNSTCLNGQPLARDLQVALKREVRLANDANCFALSEATDGAAAGAAVVFGVIIGTGCGAGVVVDRHILTGANAIAGEWGHNPLPWPREDELPGAACYCGKHGCIETWLSGPGLSRDLNGAAGIVLSTKQIAERASRDDEACESALQRYEDRMARGLAHVINILDPDVIVLGGGLSNMRRLYDNVPRLWQKYIFSDAVATRLVPPKFGDSSGVRGAAWLWNG